MKPKAWRADLPAKLVRAVIEVAPGNGAGVGDVSWVRGTLARLHHLMSGLIGHSMYGILALKEARGRGLPVAPLMERHLPSYLCGAYLGSDIQVMPEAVCVDTGREVGFGTVPLTRSPLTGGEVRPWSLVHEGKGHRPGDIHQLFYGRAHLVFGWARGEEGLSVPWDHLADYIAPVMLDGMSSERGLAYALGWLVHIVGDSLIKSVQPGLRMHLLDGVYTPRNRIVQDQFTYHAIGGELDVEWETVFRDMAAAPVEALQPHYMRVGERNGRLGDVFSEGWRPDLAPLLESVLRENRRWLVHHSRDVLEVVSLKDGRVSDAAGSASGGLDHETMLRMAEAAGMRRTLVTIADQAVDLMERVVAQVPAWKALPRVPAQPWSRLGVA